MEAISEWRALGRGKTGRRELVVKIIEVDGLWEGVEYQEPSPPPPQPKPRLVLKRDDTGMLGRIKEWLGRG